MRWRKLGLLFAPSGDLDWMRTHAAVPFAEPIAGGLFRVYFSGRDREQRSHTCELTMELGSSPRVLDVSSVPVLAPGELGCFDDSGAMLSWVTPNGKNRHMYYIGWNRGVTVPFRNALGLAISSDGQPFRRFAKGPIVDRTASEPHFAASACVLVDGETWRMWYLSCTGWDMIDGRPEHRYHLKYAESLDGICWRRQGIVAIDYRDADECAISRPSVIRDQDRWRMWFSYRGRTTTYRIGYAESDDGVAWRRLDNLAGIDVSDSGWDCEMIEYPHVFDHGGVRYMLYNGNRFGQSGLGLAVLELA
jgi:hypothetical protein